MAEAFIVAATRTAAGKRKGKLAGWHPVDLAAQVIDELVRRTGADPALVDDVILGCVSQTAEQGINVARNAVLASSLPESVPGTSVDRQCGSSQQAIHFAAQAVMSGAMDVVIAAGVESMTRVPMFATSEMPRKAGMGFYMSPAIQKRYPGIEFSQFMGAEMIVKKHGFTKDDLDAYAYESHLRAKAATEAGRFQREIVGVEIETPEGKQVHLVDEGIRFDATLEGIAGVKLLQEGGSITAASASQICDGASAVLICSEQALKDHGLTPRARIHHVSVTAGDPVIMLEEPLFATEKALKRAGMKIEDIDAYEVNEAFAPVPLAWLKYLGADHSRLNVHGGAIALGHPLGASGTKLMATLLGVLDATGGKYGLQTMCEGGGQANVTIIERL